MIKFIKNLLSPNLTGKEQKVLALKKYNMKKIEWQLHWSSNPMNPKEEYWGNIEGLGYIIEYDQRYFNYNVYFDDSGEYCYFDKILSNMKGREDDLKLLVELHANIYLDKDGYI